MNLVSTYDSGCTGYSLSLGVRPLAIHSLTRPSADYYCLKGSPSHVLISPAGVPIKQFILHIDRTPSFAYNATTNSSTMNTTDDMMHTLHKPQADDYSAPSHMPPPPAYFKINSDFESQATYERSGWQPERLHFHDTGSRRGVDRRTLQRCLCTGFSLLFLAAFVFIIVMVVTRASSND